MHPHDRNPAAIIALTASDVTVLIDASASRIPAVVHWGQRLPALDAARPAALTPPPRPVPGPTGFEPVPRVAVVPEHHTGWTGRPGLRGSYAGAGWSPAFRTTLVSIDGTPVTGFLT